MLLNKYSRVIYADLPDKAKESYNFQKASAVLAEYGFITNLLKYDWHGADFFAQHINGDWLKIQLKGRLVTSPIYEGKDLFIMFEDKKNSKWYLYPHDELTRFCRENYPNAVFTIEGHSRGTLSSWNKEWLKKYEINYIVETTTKKNKTFRELNFDYKKYQDEIELIDREFIDKFNPRNKIYTPQIKLRPCPFEGNLKKAKVILLLANPGFTPLGKNKSSEKDHDRNGFDDWGLWGLSARTNPSMHKWWRDRLKSFVKNINSEDEWRQLSWKIASVQAVPWASENFHEMNGLPSKKLIADTVKAISKGKIFVIMRQRTYWEDVLKGQDCKIIYTKRPISSYLTNGNLDPVDFKKLKSILT